MHYLGFMDTYYKRKRDVDNIQEDLYMKSVVLKDKVVSNFIKVANYFANPLGDADFSEFEEQVRAVVGNKADYLLNQVADYSIKDLNRSNNVSNFIKKSYENNDIFLDFLSMINDSFEYKKMVKESNYLKEVIPIIDKKIRSITYSFKICSLFSVCLNMIAPFKLKNPDYY